MEVGGLISRMFELDHEFIVPDVLYEQELRENHTALLELGLKALELHPPAIDYAAALAAKYLKASRIDLFALALAWQEECSLLTGDQALRLASKREGIEVVGTIWVVGEMLDARVLTKKDARAAYDGMKASGRRLPWAEVEKQLRG